MRKPALEGTCICTDVQIAVAKRPREITQCNCSVCRRYGTLWAYYAPKEVSIKAARGALVSYSKLPRGLRFVHCKGCGCVICWKSPRSVAEYMGVNARLLEHRAMANVRIKVLDGDMTWKRLDTYKRPDMFISPHRVAE